MPSYTAPLDDIKFVLHDVLDAPILAELPGYDEADKDTMDAVLEEGAKICQDTLFPLNMPGDEEGCALKDGEVIPPKGFKEAYDLFTEGGWCGLSADPDYGGSGMPHLLNFAFKEMICSANMSFGMYPGLSEGAYDAIHMHGTDEQKAMYLPKIIEGVWSGTMNLTEPQCGTDLSLIRTKAEPHPDGDDSYAITGTKIWISAGEHNMVENIVHLVLAKLPDAPEGMKGISLFVVPKFLVKEENGDYVPGERNKLECSGLEHKMGIKASATCVMNYDGAKGWLVGKPHSGLRAMFTMMNNARLGVGMQGLGIAEVAYQNGLAFAKDRLQMRSLDGPKHPDKPADPIIVHPDIRRQLMISKAGVEGIRALAYWVGMELDISHKHPDEARRQEAEDFVALMTPIIKAYGTDMGLEIANHAVQIHGGSGYCVEYGVEQYVRDIRIALIYEGTNGIQALDLVGRKMGQNMGRLLRRFFHPCQKFIEDNQSNEDLQQMVFGLAKAFAKLQQSTATIAQKGLKDPIEAGAASSDYLRQFALVSMAFIWAKMAKIAHEKLESGEGDKAFYETKIKTARFFFERMLPEADARFKMVMAGAASMMDLDETAF